MSQLLVGLIGVIVGGLLTGLSSWLLDISRDRRHERDREEQEARDLKRVARLVGEELYVNLSLLCRAVESQRWWNHPSHSLRTNRWDQYEPVFAGADVPDEVWGCLTIAYHSIRELNGSAEERATMAARCFTAKDEEDLRMEISSINDGRMVLAELNGEPAIAAEPDVVMAMRNAATLAARELFAANDKPVTFFADREELRVVSNGHSVLGVALLRPPHWTAYRCDLPLDSKLTVVMPAIDGTCVCAVSPLGERDADSEMAKKFVPDEIRGSRDYSNFILLLELPRDRALVAPWSDGNP